MARLPLYLLSVLGALYVAQAFSACALKRTSSLRFSAKSMVDELGQRIVTVDGLGQARDKDVLGVSVDHWTAQCSDLQVVGLQLNVTGPMGDNEQPPVPAVAERLNYTSTTDLPPPPTPTAPACNHGYELVPDVGCYKWRPKGNNWQQAQSICESEGAHLAVPNTQQEFDALKKLRISGGNYPWVGIKKQNGTWKSIEGGDALLIWERGQPNGKGDCLILRDGGLYDYSSTHTDPSFICEQRSV